MNQRRSWAPARAVLLALVAAALAATGVWSQEGSYDYPLPRLPSDGEIKQVIAKYTQGMKPGRPANVKPGDAWVQYDHLKVIKQANNPGPAPYIGPVVVVQWDQGTFYRGDKDIGETTYGYAVIGCHKSGSQVTWGAAKLVICKTAGERDAAVARIVGGGGKPEEPAERPTLKITSSSIANGQLTVAGIITSKAKIRSTLIMRSEGGALAQGHMVLQKSRFTATCPLAPGVPNVFKVTCENEDGLGAEATIRTDASGKLTGAQTSTAEGEIPAAPPTPVAAEAPAEADTPEAEAADKVPGLGGVGDVPGPANARQAAAGVLIPTLVAAALRVLLGGGTAPPPVPPAAPEAPPAVPPGALPPDRKREGEEGKGGTDLKGPGAAPPPPPPDPAGEGARATLNRLGFVAGAKQDPALAKAVEEARQQAFDASGKLIPEKWAAAKQQMKAALDAQAARGERPNSAVGDAVREGVYAVGSLAGQAAVGAATLGVGVLSLPVQGVLAVRSAATTLAVAVTEPRVAAAAAQETVRGWVAGQDPGLGKLFDEGIAKGQLSKVGASMFMGLGLTGAHVAKEILPIDEVKSVLYGEDLGERLWAGAAAVTKVASLATMFVTPAVRPATAWGAPMEKALAPYLERFQTAGLAQVADAAQARITNLQTQAAALERTVLTQEARQGGVQAVLNSTLAQIEKQRTLQASAQAAIKVDTLTRQALADGAPMTNFQQAQLIAERNPALAAAMDEAILANRGTNALGAMRANGLITEEAHALLTGRKLGLQDQVFKGTFKQMALEEVAAREALGEAVPSSFHAGNATQGSRTNLSGSNVNADLDATFSGMHHVGRDRANQILTEQTNARGMTREALDMNAYVPGRGVADARGAAANAEAMVENTMQTTGMGYRLQVHRTASGEIVTGEVVTTQGREFVLHARSGNPPAGMTREQWLNGGAWEGYCGRPNNIPLAEWEGVRRTQLEGVLHAAERGDLNQMVKYANRGIKVGLGMDSDTADLIREVSGQKDPFQAGEILRAAGIDSVDALLGRLGLA